MYGTPFGVVRQNILIRPTWPSPIKTATSTGLLNWTVNVAHPYTTYFLRLDSRLYFLTRFPATNPVVRDRATRVHHPKLPTNGDNPGHIPCPDPGFYTQSLTRVVSPRPYHGTASVRESHLKTPQEHTIPSSSTARQHNASHSYSRCHLHKTHPYLRSGSLKPERTRPGSPRASLDSPPTANLTQLIKSVASST